jgi:hypothetical protein
MAPHIGRSRRDEPYTRHDLKTVSQPTSPAIAEPPAEKIAPEQIRAVLTKIAELNRHIAETCDYVGKAFAEEARKIHYGETEHREIYGEATPSEAAELQEEGIAVAAVPWLRRSDS